jgi:hypothetical protein
MLAASSERVRVNTAEHVNQAIQEETDRSIAYFVGHPDEIPGRLEQLDREWDVERALATGSSCLSLLGLALGLSGRPRWFYLPLGVQGFYLQHALQGWCPPLPLFRRLGFRTPSEIERERCALKELSGDSVPVAQ